MDDSEAAMFHALGSILRRGSFDHDEVEALATVVEDADVEPGARRFALSAMEWLAQVHRRWR